MGQRIPLFYLAHSRSGDKGDAQTLSLIPYRREDYALIAEQVTPRAVKRHFGASVKGEVLRYDLPKLAAFNFVLLQALEGGVNDSLALDAHGKSRSSIFLAMAIEVPDTHPCLKKMDAQVSVE